MKSLFIPFYWSRGGKNRVHLKICIMTLLEEVTWVDVSLLQKAKGLFGAVNWHWLLILNGMIGWWILSKTSIFLSFTAALRSQGLCCGTQHNWPCVSGWPRRSHSFPYKKPLLCVLRWCPPPFPQRLQQQTALPGAIFDYTPLRLNLRETGVLIQGDPVTGDNPSISWLELNDGHCFLASLNKSRRFNGWFVSLAHQCISTLGISPRTFIYL